MIPDLLDALKVLADASRLKILGRLSERECSVGEIAQQLELSEPTISHHLARLARVGFVAMRPVGTMRLYRLDEARFGAFQRRLSARPGIAERDATSVPVMDVGKVLDAFVVDGKLAKIPEKRKKRRVILEWLVDQLETGRRYPEKELNAFIRRFHDDPATLRREFVACHLMQREDSVYWRI